MRASGKTTVGRALAARLGRPFLDLDDATGRLAGCTADELLAGRGEPAFRAVEEQALREAATLSGHVIATGGGSVLHPVAFPALAATGTVIWLAAPIAWLLAHGRQRPRPPLTSLPTEAEVAALLAQREPLYRAAAQITIPMGDVDPILALLQALEARDER
jgi:shikimate kinase